MLTYGKASDICRADSLNAPEDMNDQLLVKVAVHVIKAYPLVALRSLLRVLHHRQREWRNLQNTRTLHQHYGVVLNASLYQLTLCHEVRTLIELKQKVVWLDSVPFRFPAPGREIKCDETSDIALFSD